MNIFEKLGFKKADEMDLHIALIAVRSSWIVMLIALLAWSIYDAVTELSITMPLIVMALGLLVYYSVTLYVRNKLSNENQE